MFLEGLGAARTGRAAALDAGWVVVRTCCMHGDRHVPGPSSRTLPALVCCLAVACGGGGATGGAAGRPVHEAGVRPFVPDYIGRYATRGALADGGSVRLLSNGGVKLRWRGAARLLRVGPWGRIEVSCTRPAPRAEFRLSATATGESALAQAVVRRVAHPLALVPIEHQGSPITVPRSGPPQRLTTVQLSVATEAMSVAGTFLVSVQWNRTGCEASTTAVLITHRS
jgi:hypothetical protein